MSRSTDPPNDDAPLDPQVERLVAYLDGELPPEEGERFESELVDDPAARTRLEDLGRVWNALDALPRATAPASFTQSTVEMAATAGDRPATIDGPSAKRRGWLGVGLLVAGIAASLGWLFTVGLSGALDRRDLIDLPAAVHATALEQATSVGFLRDLSRELSRLIEAYADEPRRFEADDWSTVQEEAIAPRRVWIDRRTPAELAALSDRMARFRALSEARQDAAREFSRELASQPDADELRRVALAYESAVSRLPASEQARLRELNDADRLRELKRRFASDLVRAALFRLTDEEAARLREAIARLADRPAVVRQRIDRLLGERGLPEEPIDRFTLLTAAIARSPQRAPRELQSRSDRLIEFWRVNAESAAEALPDRVRRRLADADSDRDLARGWLLILTEAAPRDAESVFLTRLSNDQIDRALQLPRDRFNESLVERVAAPPPTRGPGLIEGAFGPPPGGPPGFGGRGPGRRGPPGPPPRGPRGP